MMMQCSAASLKLSAEAMEILAAKLFSTWEALWDGGEMSCVTAFKALSLVSELILHLDEWA